MKKDPVVTIQDALKQSSLYFQLKKNSVMGKSKTRKSSVSGYMLTDAQLTELIEKSTVKATEKPGQSKNSSNGNGKRQ